MPPIPKKKQNTKSVILPGGRRLDVSTAEPVMPDIVRAFQMQGIEILWRPGRREATGTCPICDAEGKFSINTTSGQWHCVKNCWRGNRESFLQSVWEHSKIHTDDLQELAESKHLLSGETLAAWGVRRSFITGEWLVPSFNADGKVSQLYRYVWDGKEERYYLLPTIGYGHGLLGVPVLLNGASKSPDVFVAEGLWDGAALYEALGEHSPVCATPSASIFSHHWAPLFAGKHVHLMYDNDHPVIDKAGERQDPVGFAGVKRTAGILKGLQGNQKPKAIRYLKWGDEGHDPELAAGWDLRDHVSQYETREEREQAVKELLVRIVDVPNAWPIVKLGIEEAQPLACNDWEVLLAAWKDAFHWTGGLEKALVAILSSAISTQTVGEQVWIRLMSPPSSGKSTLCEALAVSKKYVYSKDVFTGLFSGYKSDKDGEEDHSLLPKINGKTLIIKEGDTIMKSPNRAQLMSELRAAYDGAARVFYRHGVDRDYEGFRFTVIFCGTNQMRSMDAADLGARFIDCNMIDEVTDEMNKKVVNVVLDRLQRNQGSVANGKAESTKDAKVMLAQRLTAGYLEYLRDNVSHLTGSVAWTDEAQYIIPACGEFVAYMRARESVEQTEVVEREFSYRLVEQYGRLAIHAAAVLGRHQLDSVVLNYVRQVAMDTARGSSLNLIRYMLAKDDGTGFENRTLQTAMGEGEEQIAKMLRFLRKIQVLEVSQQTSRKWAGTRSRWRVADKVRDLYLTVSEGNVVIPTDTIEEEEM